MNFLSSRNCILAAVLVLMGSIPLRAENWIQTAAPITNWTGLTCSADGTQLAATTSDGPIYISTNSGLTWIETSAPIAAWRSIAGSADGRVLAAWKFNSYDPSLGSFGSVYISTNGGATWLLSNIPEDVQEQLAVSADGTRIAGCWSSDYPTRGGRMYLSADSGVTWSTKPGDYRIMCIAFSADGSTLAVCGGVSITVSTNFGDSWQRAVGGKLNRFALSSDASTIFAAGLPMWDFGLHFSTNAGLTWATADLPMGFWSPAMSADGRKFVAAGFVENMGPPTYSGLSVYTSEDAGATWAEGPRCLNNSVILAVSADANRIVAAERDNGGIYLLQSTPKPQLEIAASATAVKVSWLVPSTRFTLQQSPSPTSGDWQDISQAPVMNYSNLHCEVTVPAGINPMFYRLVSR